MNFFIQLILCFSMRTTCCLCFLGFFAVNSRWPLKMHFKKFPSFICTYILFFYFSIIISFLFSILTYLFIFVTHLFVINFLSIIIFFSISWNMFILSQNSTLSFFKIIIYTCLPQNWIDGLLYENKWPFLVRKPFRIQPNYLWPLNLPRKTIYSLSYIR
jgi:hypothetical protein